MSVREDPLDRALRDALPVAPSADDDAAWLARTMGALDAATPAAAQPELDALLGAPCPDGAVEGEPRADVLEAALEADEPWRADEEAEARSLGDHGAIASHASEESQKLGHLARVSIHPPAREERVSRPSGTRPRRVAVGRWAAGLALAAAAVFGVFQVSLRERRDASVATTAATSPPSKDDLKSEAHEPVAVASAAPAPIAAPSASAAPTVALLDKTKATAGDMPSKPESAPPAPKAYATIPVGTATPTATAATPMPTATAKPTAAGTAAKSVPSERPEPLDVRSALNFRIGAANACVVGTAGESHVTIAFGPSGLVTSVVVTDGPAKGTSAEACIQKAFSTARVDPSRLGGTGYAVVSGGSN